MSKGKSKKKGREGTEDKDAKTELLQIHYLPFFPPLKF